MFTRFALILATLFTATATLAEKMIIVGAPIAIQTNTGDRFSGMAWNDGDLGRFCAVNAQDVICYGIYPAVYNGTEIPLSFVCTDGGHGTATVGMVPDRFAIFDIMRPVWGRGTLVPPRGPDQNFNVKFGTIHFTTAFEIPCRAPLVAWERAGEDISIFPDWDVAK